MFVDFATLNERKQKDPAQFTCQCRGLGNVLKWEGAIFGLVPAGSNLDRFPEFGNKSICSVETGAHILTTGQKAEGQTLDIACQNHVQISAAT
jgi:hypothetical protein